MDRQKRKAVVVGQGYVGLPLSLAALDAGYEVTGVDLDQERIDALALGQSPIRDVPDVEIQRYLLSGAYTPTSDYETVTAFSVAVITVPTPLRQGKPDLSYIESAGYSISQKIRVGSTVVLESTTYPGTTEEMLIPILEKGSGLRAGEDFFIGYSPERIDPGNPSWNLINTPKVVSGINPQSLDKVEEFYRSLGITTVAVSGTREAEMTKLLENTFRHVNIALVNELAMFSASLGVDLWESIEAASTKPFGFMKFTPGPGVGGHCLPIDPNYLSWAIQEKGNSEFKFVSLANSINNSMPFFVRNRLIEILGQRSVPIQDSRLVIVGLAYKPDSADIRESPALVIAELLAEAGADVYAVDPLVPKSQWPGFIAVANKDEAFDAAILVTNHSDLEWKWAVEASTDVLDTQNCLTGVRVHRL